MEQDFVRGIYAIGCDGMFDSPGSYRLLYSPFNGKMALVDEKEWAGIREGLMRGSEDPRIRELINDSSIDEVHDLPVKSVKDVVKLSVLPTNKCNFACSYCYSREGRDATQVSRETLDRTLEYFIDPSRTEKRELTISYLGGGEPMLCWELFRHSLDYSEFLASKYGFRLMNSVNTNGSILTDDILDCLLRHDVTVCVTFEVFEDIQEAQRGQWRRVRENIHAMLERGVRVIISSIITPLNVDRIERLVRIVTEEYPGVRTLILEPVVDMTSTNFKSLQEISDLYKAYAKGFFCALPVAEAHGVRLLNSVIRKMWRLHTRFCDGEISLTALGTISGCTSVSSPREAYYEQYCYGDANVSPIKIDNAHFEDLLRRDVFSYPQCRGCFLKWHCAGGCSFRNDLYTPGQMEIVCDFNRDFALKYLLNVLEHNLKLEGDELSEMIKNGQ